ncbi:MAG: globin-coupled sensor protein [Oceanicaulis sp.]
MTGTDWAERLAFIEAAEGPAPQIAVVREALGRAMPDLLDSLYREIRATPHTSGFFSDGDTIGRARGAMERHWSAVLDDGFDRARAADAARIGLMHAGLGLEPQWYMGAYARVAAGLVHAAVKAGVGGMAAPGRADRAAAAAETLVRLFVLDMEMAVTAYLEARDRRAAAERAETADEIEANVGETADALAAAAETLDLAARAVTEAMSHTVEAASSAAAGSEEAAASVRSVAAASSQLGAASKEISGQTASQSAKLGDAVGKVESASRTIGELSEASGEIGAVIALIERVAEQTNLLALNATIEAARAGEAGKGFAVVADEVKQLADQTARATEQISQKISAMQDASRFAVDAIGEIRTVVDAVSGSALAIEAAVEEQSASIQEITRSAEDAAHGNQSAAEAAASLDARTRGGAEAAASVGDAAETVRSRSGQLRAQLDGLLAKIRAA